MSVATAANKWHLTYSVGLSTVALGLSSETAVSECICGADDRKRGLSDVGVDFSAGVLERPLSNVKVFDFVM